MKMKEASSIETVFVGLSGGVDSSVAAKRLLNEGKNVVGVFIKTWQPDFLTCNWEAERLDAMKVAAHLEIPFFTCDAVDSYRDNVAEYMIAEYKKGRTPNPDVMCNRYVKFGIFYDFMKSHGGTTLATGHYAQIKKTNGGYHLCRGIDVTKDQSYFLWTLSQEQLSHITFPVGNSLKSAIRKEAGSYSLPTFTKADSQGVCFLGDINMKEFLSHYVHSEEGSVVDETGKQIGTHDGALFYTMGQRHGFTLHTKVSSSVPYYVTEKNMTENTITVSPRQKKLTGKDIVVTELNMIQGTLPTTCTAQFRYRQTPFSVSTTFDTPERVILEVADPDIDLPSLGQSCVFYNADECLGGGIISEIR